MIEEIWDTITEAIGTAWEAVTSIFSSGLFDEVNFTGWLLLTIAAEITLWAFYYYVVYVKEVINFLDLKIMIMATLLGAPVAAYIFALREAKR